MGILYWIILGLLAGAIAKAITPGRDPQGCIITMVIGIVGSVIGGFVARALGFSSESGHHTFIYNLLIATGGAVLLLVIYHAIIKPRV